MLAVWQTNWPRAGVPILWHHCVVVFMPSALVSHPGRRRSQPIGTKREVGWRLYKRAYVALILLLRMQIRVRDRSPLAGC